MDNKALLKLAVESALNGHWDESHNIAQSYSDPIANWIHAVLHKIEGDKWNSNYWYSRTLGKRYEEFADPKQELRAILMLL